MKKYTLQYQGAANSDDFRKKDEHYKNVVRERFGVTKAQVQTHCARRVATFETQP